MPTLHDEFATTKVISKACAAIDQRKTLQRAPKHQQSRELGRFDKKFSELAEAVEKYRNPKSQSEARRQVMKLITAQIKFMLDYKRRELEYLPKAVADGEMSQHAADTALATVQAIIQTLRHAQDAEAAARRAARKNGFEAGSRGDSPQSHCMDDGAITLVDWRIGYAKGAGVRQASLCASAPQSSHCRASGGRMIIDLHPLCTLFPRIEGAEFVALKADIVANGLRHPIVLHAGFILDGGNRYRACMEAGVEPQYVEFAGDNIVSFVLSSNMHRRHLTPGQQAAIVASAQDWSAAQSVGNPAFKAQQQRCNVAPLATAADRAGQSGASLRTQKMADAVARKSPELARQVAHGEISLPKAIAQLAPPAPPATVSPVEAWPFPSKNAAVPAPEVEYAADVDVEEDNTPDLIAELSQAEREIADLRSELADLRSRLAVLTSDGAGAAVEAMRIERDQARSLGEQRFNELAAAKRDSSQYKSLLGRLRKLGDVETNSDLCDLVASVRAKAA